MGEGLQIPIRRLQVPEEGSDHELPMSSKGHVGCSLKDENTQGEECEQLIPAVRVQQGGRRQS